MCISGLLGFCLAPAARARERRKTGACQLGRMILIWHRLPKKFGGQGPSNLLLYMTPQPFSLGESEEHPLCVEQVKARLMRSRRRRFTLSLRERAGVRGKGACDCWAV